jgi:hypothetical protein
MSGGEVMELVLLSGPAEELSHPIGTQCSRSWASLAVLYVQVENGKRVPYTLLLLWTRGWGEATGWSMLARAGRSCFHRKFLHD